MTDSSFPTFVHSYLDDLYIKGRKASTIKRYEHDFVLFFRWFSHQTKSLAIESEWINISKEQVQQFIAYLFEEKEHQIRTVRRIHSALKQLAKYCIKENLCKEHPFAFSDAPELVLTPLKPSEWVSSREASRFIEILQSNKNLSEQQLEVRPLLKARNEFIVKLFLHYGLTLQEAVELTMTQMKFESGTIEINGETGKRSVHLSKPDRELAFTYYQKIPEPVRPRLHENDPFLVAFDFQRKTYRWSYEEDKPKQLTNIAIQKMIRLEVARGELRKGISAQHLRNRFILHALLEGELTENVQKKLGLKSPLSFHRYMLTIDKLTEEQRLDLLQQ
ncbi:tyrosine-type recombinase/integrase [Alkalihalobacillus sp. 1P02AB]|uniref:tyrosine-type recombinase/integrase n=1 Tax=Alkalihalobacillus sp. 1P02AB TaxID=3132260 RepID=UPI0039A6E59E